MILIIGNGSIGNDKGKRFFINSHTGVFLKKLQEEFNLSFMQGATVYDINSNLQNFDLRENNIDFLALKVKKTFSFLLKTIRICKKYDFIYIFYPGSLGKLIALVSFFLNKPYALYIRGQYYNQGNWDRFILKQSKFILTVSPSIQKDLNRFCDKVDVIKPMIDIGLEDLYEDRLFKIPKQWNLLFVGRVEFRKGIVDLIEIARLLKKRNIKFILHIVGGGDMFEEVKQWIVEYGLIKEVKLHGLISDKQQLQEFYKMSDAFVFTSHDEGFPRVLYEAMANALPIFTTFVGGIPGRMIHEENCIEIPVQNAKESTERIVNQINQPKKLEFLGKAGLKTVKKMLESELLPHEDLLKKNIKEWQGN